jgi:hypothetical protein
MSRTVRNLGVAIGLTVALGVVAAADDKEKKAALEKVVKLAGAVEKKDKAAVQGLVNDLKKAELLDVMTALKLRKNGGLGIGDKEGAVTPDGIEAKLIGMAKKPMGKSELDKQAADLEKAAYVMAGIADVAVHKCPVQKKQGEKDPAAWKKWCDEMRDGSLELAAALKKKDETAVKNAAAKVNSSCNNCHGIFRD